MIRLSGVSRWAGAHASHHSGECREDRDPERSVDPEERTETTD